MKTIPLSLLLIFGIVSASPREMAISIAYGNGMFVAAMGNGIYSSSNGSHWASAFATGSQSYYTGIAFGKGIFVAVGLYGESSNNRFKSAIMAVPYQGLNSVAFGNNQFVAVGIRGKILSLDSCVAVTSSDGMHWEKTKWR